MATMNAKWVVLCSAAVAAVYAAGYYTTEAQASLRQTEQLIQANAQPNGAQSNKSSAGSTAQTKAKTMYKDGTYTGMGSNRRGSIQVAVTIRNDKITDVEISGFAMHYSKSDVVGLPAEVLRNQSAQVENVTGATYSTRAFEDAVKDALAQAHNV